MARQKQATARKNSNFDPMSMGFHRVPQTVRLDARGRMTLRKLANTPRADSYGVFINDAGQILLEPMVEIPAREQWLFGNFKAKALLEASIESARTKPAVSLGSFAKFANDDPDGDE